MDAGVLGRRTLLDLVSVCNRAQALSSPDSQQDEEAASIQELFGSQKSVVFAFGCLFEGTV